MAVRNAVTGADKLQRLLTQLEPKVGKKVVRQALRDGAKLVQSEARREAPVLSDLDSLGSRSQGRTPGLLRRNILVRSMRSNKPARGRFRIGVMMAKRGRFGIPPGDKWFYPAIVHAGHANADARPFMRTAADRMRRAVHSRIERRLRVGILSEARAI